ncbi:hypothetical protein NDU88_000877 [Pleurodeles waltl]|uniref:Uncharacterized protein n=1 Tax=Pleurodeles waltl TaxID=8319 RepID=A0AAV7KWY3_PLEWA|nr:hypothetical protein NDU88_000877 [Pleurodeles waltl]
MPTGGRCPMGELLGSSQWSAPVAQSRAALGACGREAAARADGGASESGSRGAGDPGRKSQGAVHGGGETQAARG